jgi:hypothetical protein
MAALGAGLRLGRVMDGDKPAPQSRIGFYVREPRRAKMIAIITGLLLFCAAYGAVFAFFAPAFLVTFAVPLALFTVLVIWALPEGDYAPVQLLQPLYLGFFLILFLWPNYLAVALPGLPWITLLRAVALPLTGVLLVCISVSHVFRRRIAVVMGVDPWAWRLLVCFVAIQTFSIAISVNKSLSANQYISAQTNLTATAVISSFLFSRPGFSNLWIKIILAILVILCVIGVWEYRIGHVLWADHIPSFLRVEDKSVLKALGGSIRHGEHRVQATSTTALGLAEFLGLAAPFALHYVFGPYPIRLRIAAALLLPVTVTTVVITGSRLGLVLCLLGLLFYLLLWAALRWRRIKKSIVAPAIVIAYPAIFTSVIAATFFVGRLRIMVWGGGAEAASNEGRKHQWLEGLPKLFHRPWGHGEATAASVLQVYNGSTLTIDSYWLSILLDYGILGFIAFYGLFARMGWVATKELLVGDLSPELSLLLPIAVSMINFIVVKSVFSQDANHPLMFMLVGGALGLIYQAQKERSARKASAPIFTENQRAERGRRGEFAGR